MITFAAIICDHPKHPSRYKETGYYQKDEKFFMVHLPNSQPIETTQDDFEFWITSDN